VCSDVRYNHILENLDANNATAQKEVGLVNSIKKLEEQAQSATDGGHFNTAISLLDRALALAPSNDRAKLMQADAYIRLNNLGQADRMVSYVTPAPPAPPPPGLCCAHPDPRPPSSLGQRPACMHR